MDRKQIFASWLLRVGLASVFFYAAVASIINPDAWVGFFPPLLRNIFPDAFLLWGFSIYEIALGLWLLWGRWTKYAAYLYAATIAGIMLANPALLDLTFRDIGLFFAALALGALY